LKILNSGTALISVTARAPYPRLIILLKLQSFACTGMT